MELVLVEQALHPVARENVLRIVAVETLCRSFALFAGRRDRESGRIDAASEGARSLRRDGALIQHWHWPRENQLQAREVTQESCVHNTITFVIYERIYSYIKLYVKLISLWRLCSIIIKTFQFLNRIIPYHNGRLCSEPA